jgi:hypothetical protein
MLMMRTVAVSLALLGFAALVASPAALERLYADPGEAPGYDVAVGGGYAYVSGNDGVSIYDIREPERASRVAEPDWVGGPAFGLWLEDATLYVAAIDRGLLIVDVSDPLQPEIVGRYGGQVDDVMVHRGVAYVSSYFGNLQSVDVSDPEHPAQLARFSWSNATGAAASGDFVYVTDPHRGIVELDVTDPASPVELRVLADSGGANGLEVRDGWLMAALYTRGLRAYDLADPRSPRLAFTWLDSGEAWDVAGEYPILCTADLQEGVEVIDASAPYGSREIATDADVAPHAIAYADGYLHLADQDEGYVLLRLTLDR